MKYVSRKLESKFLEMSKYFKSVLVTGARQVGKTTMLKHLAENENRTYVTLDDAMARELAKSDPVLFFQTYKPPIIIDEIQYATELFPRIKIMCDNSEETGLFWLTGSQQYSMMKNVRESLAGRIGILNLYSLSQNEIRGVNFENEQNYSLDSLLKRQEVAPKPDIHEIYEYIWRGGMPGVQNLPGSIRQEFFNSYIDTYLMRDVVEEGKITDMGKFRKFLVACASLVSEQVNYKTLADVAEISQPTAKNWLKLLEGLGIVYLLKPYSNNHLKRLVKTPKLYFCDTGLCAYLSMWLSKDTLLNGAASGHYFENYVVTEILKAYAYGSVKVNLYYFRDSNGKEIDLLIETGEAIHPLEIKKTANPNKRDVKKFDVLQKANAIRGMGGIICMCENVTPIDSENTFIPCTVI